MATTPFAASQPLTRDESRGLAGRTMGLVALTAAAFAVGAYVADGSAGGWSILWFLGAFVTLVAMHAAARRSEQLAVSLLLVFGFLLGLATSSTIAYYVMADPEAVWEAGGCTALFIAAFGAVGFATRRDLSVLTRWLLWALVALIAFGFVEVFVHIPGGAIVYALVGLAIFAGFTVLDFQRLRRVDDIQTAPLLAASIFLDVLNIFQLFLSLFDASE
jgi:FtsH-binding integral membrane protein